MPRKRYAAADDRANEKYKAKRKAFHASPENKAAVAERKQNKANNAAERELAQRELCRRNLIAFVIKFNPGYLAGWVHKDICRRLEQFKRDVAAGLSPRLMLQMPPRHGKSQLASQDFPSWVLGEFPKWEFIVCSYSSSLALDFSRTVRGRLKDPEYCALFKTRLSPERQNAEGWLTTAGGGFLPAGVGGAITGKGANILIIDDPVKNAEEADSQTNRENTWKWYTTTAYTRLAPGAGVLVIQCMVGGTQVLMADGTERALRDIRPGDNVATYDDGKLATSVVENWINQGYDECFTITTSSGKVVQANERHPFLVETEKGPKWIRTRDLQLTQRIVMLRDNGVSGREKPVWKKAVASLFRAVGTAHLTIISGSGNLVTALRQLITGLIVKHTSSTAMVLLMKNMSGCTMNKKVSAQCVSSYPQNTPPLRGVEYYALTTATTLVKPEPCFATNVTSQSGAPTMSNGLKLFSSTSDFMLDEIVSITSVGSKEVFDVQIRGTENFIANGVVSSNTRWHDDDLSGKLEREMVEGSGDQFEIVRYPAQAEENEKYRNKGDALHSDRYPTDQLERIKSTVGPRTWSALYQQNPTPDDGAYFQRSMIQYYYKKDIPDQLSPAAAWDLAISEKEHADWTVGVNGGLDLVHNVYITDGRRGRWDANGIVDEICDSFIKHEPGTVGIEKGQISLTMGPLLDAAIRERRLYRMNYEELPPGKRDKIGRARTLQGLMRQGKVYFPHPSEAPWVEQMVNELLRFPYAVHDDWVDALAWLAIMMTRTGLPGPTSSRLSLPKSWKEKLNMFMGDSKHKSAMSA